MIYFRNKQNNKECTTAGHGSIAERRRAYIIHAKSAPFDSKRDRDADRDGLRESAGVPPGVELRYSAIDADASRGGSRGEVAPAVAGL